jgi:hypothetical protein
MTAQIRQSESAKAIILIEMMVAMVKTTIAALFLQNPCKGNY